ncbi:type II toxin-antitoxin system HicA family toxin [Alsobacter sp. KACC 23698]|uniref:Type II toxin-antitoxin system HicA family toxin n=1 Tax=Alsobacter sp. KACC 23698 TaxID=3149229 RepID=A0AAU7JC61_9HYPH
MVDYGKLLRRVLQDHGWRFLRPAKGDHQIWIHDETGRTISIDAGSKSRQLSNSILKRLGLPKAF